MSHRNVFYYDTRSNLACVRDPDLGLTYYEHDAGDRMTAVKNPFGEVTYYDYRPDGQVSRRVLGNGCVTYYDYDAVGRTVMVDNRAPDLSVIASFEYQYDDADNPIAIAREDGAVVYYEYDRSDQLTRETHVAEGEVTGEWAWDYDAAGNRLYETQDEVTTYYEHNAANELVMETTGEDVTYYSYDGSGNLIARQAPTGTTYFGYDTENHMVRMDLEEGGHSYYSYDADGKRVRIHPDGFDPTSFIYQGPDLLRLQTERDAEGATVAHYTIGAAGGLEAQRRDEASSFYHFDWLGSTFALTDAAQDVTDSYRYNAWGEVLSSTGGTTNRHTWIGRHRYCMTEGSFVALLGHRYNMPSIGRFTTRDPTRSGRNWFAYVLNGATHESDPLGLQTFPGDPPPVSLIDCYYAVRSVVDIVEDYPIGPVPGTGQGGDRWQHCVVSCVAAVNCGALMSKVLGILWEESRPSEGRTEDLEANQAGIDIAVELWWETLPCPPWARWAKDPREPAFGPCDQGCQGAGYFPNEDAWYVHQQLSWGGGRDG